MNASLNIEKHLRFASVLVLVALTLLFPKLAFADEVDILDNAETAPLATLETQSVAAATSAVVSEVGSEGVKTPAEDFETETAPITVLSLNYANNYDVLFAEGESSKVLCKLGVGDDATAFVFSQGLASSVQVAYSDGVTRDVAIARWVVADIEEGIYILRAELADEIDGVTGEMLPKVSVDMAPSVYVIPEEGTPTYQVQYWDEPYSEGAFDNGPSYVGDPIALPSGAPNVMTGSCFVGDGFDTDYQVGNFSGGLWATSAYHCADHTAANPNYQWCSYYAVAKNYNASEGWIEYKVCVIPAEPTNGAANEYGYMDYQRLVGYARMSYTFKQDLKINKTSANTGITDNNPNYSLEGAIYYVYSDVNCTNKVGEMTTAANGVSNAVSLTPGTYYVKEYAASKGYFLDSTRYTVILSNSSVTLSVKERPVTDPVSFAKKDADKANTGLGYGAQGDATVAGAEYTMEYHASNDGSGSVVRKWVFRSNENGTIAYDSRFLVSGDALYYDESGDPTLPVGSIVVYESKAPAGYVLNSTRYIGRIYQASAGNAAGFAWVNTSGTITDPVIRGGVTIAKWDNESNSRVAQGDASLNATVQIINCSASSVYVEGVWYAPGAVVKTVVLSGDGLWTSGANLLPYGTYEIIETIAPNGYLHTGVLSRTISIRNNGAIINMDTDDLALKNDVIRGGIAIEKSLTGGSVSELEGIGFAVYDAQGNRVFWKDAEGKIVDTIYLGADGKGATPNDALPYGHYRIEEIAATVSSTIMAYRYSVGAGSDVVGSVEVNSNQAVFSIAVMNFVKPELDIEKIDGDAYTAGNYEHISQPSTWVLERFEDGAWVVLQTVQTTGGKASFDRSVIDRFGTYRLREVASPLQSEKSGWMIPKVAGQAEVLEFVIDATSYSKYLGGTSEFNLGSDGYSFAYSQNQSGRAAIVVTAINWKYRTIEVQKVDSETGASIANTIFSLEKWTGNGKPVEAGGSDASGEWVKVASAETNTNGNARFDGLVFGFYRLSETVPNPAYMGSTEGKTTGTFYFEVNAANGQSQIQVVKDKPIHIETTVEKSTISKTSVGLVYKDAAGNVISNVGKETYKYEVAFSNGKTNTFSDEYWVVDNFELISDPYGLRVNVLITPVVRNDSDGKFYILIKTALGLSGKDASGMRFAQPELHADQTLCDGSQRFDATGWRLLGCYSTEEAVKLVMSELLAEGDYLTSIALCYGAVESGFTTVTNFVYYVSATHELATGTVIPNSVESHISRNWFTPLSTASSDPSEPLSGLYDDASAEVKTTVVDTFEVEAHDDLRHWSSSNGGVRVIYGAGGTMGILARTSDPLQIATAALVLIACVSLIVALGAARCRRDQL